VVFLHDTLVNLAPALALAEGLRRSLGQREALEHFFQPGQQPRFVRVAKCELYLPARNGQVHDLEGYREIWGAQKVLFFEINRLWKRP
jgi:hypothetical protein